MLDRALILWFPGPHTATGEDLAELHLHGGRAVIDAVERALASYPGLRRAEPGEFTRRALLNGVIDLTETEGLVDLLNAETASQHRQALAMSGGAVGRVVAGWQARLLELAARTEALLDFADEDDVAADGAALDAVREALDLLRQQWQAWLAIAPAERLRDGIGVVIAGPPNSGKSTLINAISEREVAIVSPIAGTTRDIVESALAIDGVPFCFADTAGLHGGTGDNIEAIGMAKARKRLAEADLVVWLGRPEDAPDHPALLRVAARADARQGDQDWQVIAQASDVVLSAVTGEGMTELRQLLLARARMLLPKPGEVALNRRQRAEVASALAVTEAVDGHDPLLLAEGLRQARLAFDRLSGVAGTEAMLDALFGRFCIGK